MAVATHHGSAADLQRARQEMHNAILEAEGDVRRCLRQVGQSSVAEADNACKEIGKRIAGIEARLASISCDEDTLESFQLLTADLRCLATRISIAARQAPPTIQIVSKLTQLTQRLGKVEYTPLKNEAQTDWYVFAISNEKDMDKTLGPLASMKQIPKGGHLGVSGLFNWDIIAQMKSEFAVLVDASTRTILFNRNMVEILSRAKSPEDFVEQALKQMKEDLKKNQLFYCCDTSYPEQFSISAKDYKKLGVVGQLSHQLNWMRRKNGALSKENFPHLQKMAQEGRIVVLRLDLCDTKAFKTIADAVQQEGYAFSSLYFSNVFEYERHDEERAKAFQDTADALKKDGTCIIDSIISVSQVQYGQAYDALSSLSKMFQIANGNP